MSARRPLLARGLPLGLLLAATGLACPVGCPEGRPQTIYEGPLESIPTERIGPCAFRLTGPELPAPYPLGSRDGFYRIDVNGYPVFKDWLVYDEQARTLVVIDEICKGRVKSFEIYFQRLLRTVNE